MAAEGGSSGDASQRFTKLSGYLKRPNSGFGLMKSYLPCWFVFNDDSCQLLCYRHESDITPVGSIDMAYASVGFSLVASPETFTVKSGDEEHTLGADSREQMMWWVKELQIRREAFHQRTLESENSGNVIPTKLKESGGAEKGVSRPVSAKVSSVFVKRHTAGKPSGVGLGKQMVTKMTSLFGTKDKMPLPENDTCQSCQMLFDLFKQSRQEADESREEVDKLNRYILDLNSAVKDFHLTKAGTIPPEPGQEPEKPHSTTDRASSPAQNLEDWSQTAVNVKPYLTTIRELEDQLEAQKMTVSVLREVIEEKDKKIMELTEKPVIVDMASQERLHEESISAYKEINKAMSEEVALLHKFRDADSKKFSEMRNQNDMLEARFRQLESKHLFLLNELSQPQRMVTDGGNNVEGAIENEYVARILKEASESLDETRAFTNSWTRSTEGTEYDHWGFPIEVRGFAERAALSQRRSGEPEARRKLESLMVKWANFLANMNGQNLQKNDEFKALVRLGIPKDRRPMIWKVLIDFWVLKFKDIVGPDYYFRLQSKVKAARINMFERQIDMDLQRLVKNRYFTEPGSTLKPMLRSLLLAYSVHNPRVGYCQGMDRLGSFALLVLQEEEEAFWCLVALVDYLLPPDYYAPPHMTDSIVDQRVLQELFEDKLPGLSAHFKQLQVDLTSAFSNKWFLTLYVDDICPDTTARIWDVLLSEGSKVLFRFALAFLKQKQEMLLQQTDLISISSVLRGMDVGTDLDHLWHIAFYEINPFPKRNILSRRAVHKPAVEDELKAIQARREERQKQWTVVDYMSSDEEGDGVDDVSLVHVPDTSSADLIVL